MKHEGLWRAHSWNGCTFTYSSFHELTIRTGQPAGTAGIKFVIDGTEHYGLHGKNHFVRPNQYLLVNEKHGFDIELPYTPSAVRGFCITLSSEVLNDIAHCGVHTQEQLLDHPAGNAAAPELVEIIYPAGDALGNLLTNLTAQLDTTTGRVAKNDELLFTQIAEALLVSQGRLSKKNSSLAARTSTRVELHKRIAHAKAIMDEAPESVSTIAALAREAALSEFHFMRCFRQLFGMSPHQYLIRRRILKAAQLLADHLPVSEVALRCGFSDVQAFSKAFRKQYGYAPSRY